MLKLNCFKCFATVAMVFACLVSADGQPGPALTVQEIQEGTNTEYNVVNHSSGLQLFNINAFAVVSTSGNPFTTDAGWVAEALNATTWLQPMGGVSSGLPTWLDYTGLSYTQAFPRNPAEVNGFTHAPGVNAAIAPGNSLDGFFFQGETGATDRFMLVNAHGPAIPIGQVITDFGTVGVVPEPSILGLGALMALCIGVGLINFRLRMARS